MLPDLPWFAWAFGCLFWGLMALRMWRRFTGRGPALDAAPGAEDGPRWSPTRERGF